MAGAGDSDSLMLATAPARVPTFVVKPSSGWRFLDLAELWHYRELVVFLAWRDISVRYKQTALGAAWALIQPLFLMLVFTLVFGVIAKLPSDGIPYPLFAYAGLLPWQLFAFALTEASNSVVANERLITKVYFPRIIIPLASVIVGLVDFAVGLVVLAGLMLFFRVPPGPMFWVLPIFILLALLTALGVGMWLAALNVQFRDVRYTLPFLTQIWLLATPVMYPSSIAPEPWRSLLALNPMSGVVDGFRWSLLGAGRAPDAFLAISLVTCVALLVSGIFYFRRMERTFADII